MDIITEFIKILELKRYSKQTINSYKGHLLLTKSHFNHKPFNSISDKELLAQQKKEKEKNQCIIGIKKGTTNVKCIKKWEKKYKESFF